MIVFSDCLICNRDALFILTTFHSPLVLHPFSQGSRVNTTLHNPYVLDLSTLTFSSEKHSQQRIEGGS